MRGSSRYIAGSIFQRMSGSASSGHKRDKMLVSGMTGRRDLIELRIERGIGGLTTDREQVPESWEHGDPYEQYVGRWSRRVAPPFLSWDLMRFFWDVAVELDADAKRMDEGLRFPLCHPEALADLFVGAGLNGVEVTAIDIPTPFSSFEDYWQPFLGGQGPAPAYAMSLDATARLRLRDRLRERLPLQGDGSLSLAARAWAIRATVTK